MQADEDLLLQLLLNLLDNAIKYTPPGGRVTAGWSTDGTSVELWVRDTGAGIAAEHLPRIFDRFYRVDKARSRAEGGRRSGTQHLPLDRRGARRLHLRRERAGRKARRSPCACLR